MTITEIDSEIGNTENSEIDNTENYKASDKLLELIKKLDSDEISNQIIKNILEELIRNDLPYSGELLHIFNDVEQLINNHFTTESKKNNIDVIIKIIDLIENNKNVTDVYDVYRLKFIKTQLYKIKAKIKDKFNTFKTIEDSSEEDIS